MLHYKIQIIHSNQENLVQQLSAILTSGIDCQIKIINGDLNVAEEWRPDIAFFIADRDTAQVTEKLSNHSCIPTIIIFPTPESNSQSEYALPDHVDVIFAPLKKHEVIYRLKHIIGERDDKSKRELKNDILLKFAMLKIVGQAPNFLEAISKIPLIADCDVNVLIQGETGVGKEVCARAVHYLSPRADKPFMPVSCGAIPTNLIENELFGHKRGAYTDARDRQLGIVAQAEGGTLFLDEIDTLSFEAQSKLLRLLQDKTYRPLGFHKDIPADIRVLAATNVDLRKKVQEGAFRSDLFYRIHVISLRIPPLRERKSDILLLAKHFLETYAKEYHRPQKSLAPIAIQKLLSYEWPGNIRELENVIQQALLLSPFSEITPENICLPSSANTSLPKLAFKEAKKRAIESFERDYVVGMLLTSHGNISQAAEKAQKDRRDFSKLINKYKINVNSFRISEN